MSGRLCEICGKRTARHVCQECGRKTCEACLEPNTWLCLECYEKIEQETPVLKAMANLTLNALFKIFLLGFILILMGMIILIFAASVSGSTESFGFFLLIGFIPIVFGVGQDLFWPLLLTIVLFVLSVGIIILWKRKAAAARLSE